MPFLPEWAPNVHPLIIHFPIAILIIAVFVDFLSVIFRKHTWLGFSASLLYIFGALATIAAFFSGRQAADLANIPSFAHPTLSEHADLGLYTVWFFGLYGLFRLAGWWKQWFQNIVVSLVSLGIALGGMFLLYETAEHGAELVFRHGVGVAAADEARKTEAERKATEKALQEGGIVESENGSWEWYPGLGAEIVLEKQFQWWLGNVSTLNAETAQDQSGKTLLSLQPRNAQVLFTAGNDLEGVQADIHINLDAFNGSFMLVHHVQDAKNFDFVKLIDNEMLLGRLENGQTKIEDRDAVNTSGWIQLRALGQGGHFRGYVNEKLVTHGHAKDLPPGPVGLLIDGIGTILLSKLLVQSIN